MLAEKIIYSAWGSFTQVTVFVGALLLLFGWINHKTGGGFVRAIERNVTWQPLIGAVLGVSPGCGGAIFVMPLFVRGVCSYGTLIATLISTMGDSAFVVISKSPMAALKINAISFVTGVVTGYVVDWLGLGKELVGHRTDGEGEEEVSDETFEAALHPPDHEDPESWGYKITHGLHWAFWALIGVGFVIGVVLLFQVKHTNMGMIAGLSIPQIIGIAGTLLCAIWMFMAKHFLSDDTYGESEEKLESMKETFIHNAHETAFVGFWVFIAYMAYELGIWALPGGEGRLEQIIAAAGVVPVILAALVGLIPGCGPQIVLVTLYCQGIVPFPAAVANAISQDGDALIPLIAMHPKSSLYATVITTIPALVIGVALYYIM
ncbi:MAG TPA: putative manganese transporter, partial [Armatimonadota bacterium]|nr:putative manganese transporter [Armatimonadota bacterium]